MELVQELVFSAVTAMLFSFLVAKLVSFAMAGLADSSASDSASGAVVEELKDVDANADADDAIVEELQFSDHMRVGILQSQKGVVSVQEEPVNRVDQFEEEEVVVGLPMDDSETGADDSVEERVATGSPSNEDVPVIEESEAIEEEVRESNNLLVSSDDDDDDDWEGIERSELENVFATAVKFVEELLGNNKDELLNGVQMELYALRKIATEGPCHDPQPMPLLLSARSKWNAWQKLGNMNPDEAMEQYVALLSDKVPGWTEQSHRVDDELESEEIGKSDAVIAPADTITLTGDRLGPRAHEPLLS